MKRILSILFLLPLFTVAQQSYLMKVKPKALASAPSCPYAVTFTRVDNLQESPTGTWGPITGNAGDGEATDSIVGNGYFQMEYAGISNRQTAICLGTERNYFTPAYVSAEFCIYVDVTTGTYRPISGGAPDETDSTAQAGDVIRINRTGSTVTLLLKRSGGEFTTIYTFATTTTLPLYMYCSQGDSGAPVYLRNPKFCNE